MAISRYIEKPVAADLKKKMVFIGGPRQEGKTWLAKKMLEKAGQDIKKRYMNWDALEDREHILKGSFPTGRGCLVLDEIHKYANWRQTVKGLYEKRGDELNTLITGCARIDHYRRRGDSLQGRYHFYHLFPLTLGELKAPTLATLKDLLHFGGFPEPFLLASEKESRRWSREYRHRLVRDDLRDLERVQDVTP